MTYSWPFSWCTDVKFLHVQLSQCNSGTCLENYLSLFLTSKQYPVVSIECILRHRSKFCGRRGLVSFASREDDLVADFKLGGVVFPPSISFLIERFGVLVGL